MAVYLEAFQFSFIHCCGQNKNFTWGSGPQSWCRTWGKSSRPGACPTGQCSKISRQWLLECWRLSLILVSKVYGNFWIDQTWNLVE